MSVMRGAAVGALTLTMLDVLVGTDQAADRAGGLLTGVADLARAFMSPDVPAIRDRSGCLDNGPAGHRKKGRSVLGTVESDAKTVALFPIESMFNPAGSLGVLKKLIP